MKTAYCTVICLIALALASAHAQPSPPAAPPPRAPAPPPGLGGGMGGGGMEVPPLTRFDLDFPGGTPRELVAAIQKATGRPLNVIIPEGLAATKLPALKMNSVDVSQLFKALSVASMKSEAISSSTPFGGGRGSYQVYQTSYGFKQGSGGELSDDTIWYFYADKPVVPPLFSSANVCRFYSLAPYLDRGVSVDDITTAIDTGWKMLGETSPPTIRFHKDTKLLIAVGEPSKLETIDDVLKALEPRMVGGGYGGLAGGGGSPGEPNKAAPAPAAKPPGKPKTGP